MKKTARIITSALLALTLAAQACLPAIAADSEDALPSSFDLRDRGVVTPVKQQEPFGTCWAFSAISAAETSILSKMGKTYEETGLDLSERHLTWYFTQPVTEEISASQAGEGLYIYNLDAGSNHRFNFGATEESAATLFAQGIGPVDESLYPYHGAQSKLAYEDLLANKEEYIKLKAAAYKETYRYYDDEELREMAENSYEYCLEKYSRNDAYSPLDDWSIADPDTPGSGKLREMQYTLTDNNIITYWCRKNTGNWTDYSLKYNGEAICTVGNKTLYQGSIDQVKQELFAGRGITMQISMNSDGLNKETWSLYTSSSMSNSPHGVCIVGWDDSYPASNFTHTTDGDGDPLLDSRGRPYSEEDAIAITTPPKDGAWIVKNSWGSETDAVKDGLTGSDGVTKDANEADWGIVDENGQHTGYFYLSYYDPGIGSPESFDFDIRSNNDQQNALQLDYLPASITEWRHIDESPMWEANIFELDKDMRIDEVAARIRMEEDAPFTGYDVTFEIYKLNEGAEKPDDGELLESVSRHFDSEGYHRTELDYPLYLKKGDRIGIAVQKSITFDDGSTSYMVSAQETLVKRRIPTAPVYGEAIINEGESFWKLEGVTDKEEASVDGWLDMTSPLTSELNKYLNRDMGEMYEMMGYIDRPINDFYSMDNFCIKAFGESVSLEYIEAAEPSCTEKGNVAYWYDSQSGTAYADEHGTEVIEDTVIPAKGHDWGEWELIKEPTDTEDGEETRKCKVCDEKETRPIPHKEPSSADDSSEPESSIPDSSYADNSEPDSSAPDSSKPDDSIPDSSSADSSKPDRSAPNSSSQSSSSKDSSSKSNTPDSKPNAVTPNDSNPATGIAGGVMMSSVLIMAGLIMTKRKSKDKDEE